MDGTQDALINLAAAAVEDREMMIAQNKTIADLTKSVAALTRQLQQATNGDNRGTGLPGDKRSQKFQVGERETPLRREGVLLDTCTMC